MRIVFIHGMWMTPLSWEHWAERYRERGHEVMTPAWPGLADDPRPCAAIRRRCAALRHRHRRPLRRDHPRPRRAADRGRPFVRRPRRAAASRPRPRLGSGRARHRHAEKASSRCRSPRCGPGWPALKNPFGKKKVTPLTRDQFYWCFTNALTREDSDAVYDRYYIPGSAQPFFEAAYPGSTTKVNFENPQRPPLLLVTGTVDRICPASLNVSTWKKQRAAPSTTDHKEYPGRCHFPGQDGWEQVADDVLEWTTANAAA
jgi:hypothetical protein